MPSVVAGLDLSLTSPGLVVRDPWGDVHAYFYPGRRSDARVTARTPFTWAPTASPGGPEGEATLHCHPLARSPATEDVARYRAIVADLMHAVRAHVPPGGAPEDVVVVMEGYAFGTGSGSEYKLKELGGILKYKVREAGWTLTVLAPTTVKKRFAGSGRADKAAMCAAFAARGLPEPLALFGRRLGRGGLVPNPVQDVVDAAALALVSREPPAAKPRSSGRKRKSRD